MIKNVIVDLSHWNQSVDFKLAKEDGIVGVIHKATQGKNYIDPEYAKRRKAAEEEDLVWGAYHFGTGEDGKDQADHFLETVGDSSKVLLALDIEENSGNNITPKQAEDFVEKVHEVTGRLPLIYGSPYFLKDFATPILTKCPLWVARWLVRPILPKGWKDWTLWQYTDGQIGLKPHSVEGIGRCDRNKFKGTLKKTEKILDIIMLLKSFKQLFHKPPKPKSSAWDAAGSGRRFSHFQPESGSINNLLSDSLETLRSRSRDMVRKNPHAANIVDVIVSNCVGTGIKPQSKAKDPELRKKIQELWLRWTDEADSSGINDFYGLQALVCRSMVEGGECFVRLRTRKPEDGLCVPLQLQVLESEHLDNKSNQTLANGNVIRNGIEFNRLGKREAYYLFREHPGEGSFKESVRVPANDILHIYRPLRPGQIRGAPWLSTVLLKLYELDQYDDAELVRKKTAAMFAGFITRLDPEANILGEGESNEQGVALSGLEPGTMQLLDPGEDIKFSQPSDVGGSYEAFMRQQLRAIAIGMGITYEQLTGDLSGVNYSSIRAGLIEFRRRCAMLQHNILVFQLCRPVWGKWIELAILSGELDIGEDWKGAKEGAKEVKWIPPGFGSVDQLKDQQAQQMAVKNGFKSRSEVVSELGYDVEEVAADQKRASELGLSFDTDVGGNFNSNSEMI